MPCLACRPLEFGFAGDIFCVLSIRGVFDDGPLGSCHQ